MERYSPEDEDSRETFGSKEKNYCPGEMVKNDEAPAHGAFNERQGELRLWAGSRERIVE
jgi:hypothetical protein